MSEVSRSPELARKNEWLEKLAAFIVKAGQHGWAAEAAKVEISQRPGFKELSYIHDEWEYRDSYAGYYMGPGSSVVYHRGRPAWYMSYGGDGQSEAYFDKARETYQFLRRALSQPCPDLPIRGPYNLLEKGWLYNFDFRGNIENATWDELIDKDEMRMFAQEV